MPPPNTPEEGVVASNSNNTNPTTTTTTLALRPFIRSPAEAGPTPSSSSSPSRPATASPLVDLHAVEYEGKTDENLNCPICRVPLVNPVVTDCGHTFCHKCLTQAHALNPVCPIDRRPLRLYGETRPAPNVVANLLDGLPVRCPNAARGCGLVVARSLVENHVARYCDWTLVACPHPSCDRTVVRRDVGKGCLHYRVECKYCERVVEKALLEEHQDRECPNRTTNCELCGAEFLRNKQEEHVKECPEVETPCKFAPLGCSRLMSRKCLEEHGAQCEYRVVGPVGQQLAELRAEMNTLLEKDRLKDRRIKFLESRGFTLPTTSPAEPMSDINLPESSDTAPYESRDQYFLSLFETMEGKVERLSSALTEVEGRHSMMLFNETLPIKDQLTEIRSTLGVLGMHVRWLMNFRLQERGRVGASGSPLPTSFTGGSSSQEGTGGSSSPRRLSDSLRENPSRL